MKWYTVLINALLYFIAVASIATGAVCIAVGHDIGFGIGYPDWVPVWYFFGGLYLVAVGAYAAYVRFQLAAFKPKAPIQYLLVLVMLLVFGVNVQIVMASSNHLSPSYELLLVLVGELVFLLLNVIYFRKRRHLFDSRCSDR